MPMTENDAVNGRCASSTSAIAIASALSIAPTPIAPGVSGEQIEDQIARRPGQQHSIHDRRAAVSRSPRCWLPEQRASAKRHAPSAGDLSGAFDNTGRGRVIHAPSASTSALT